ncbi:MAG: glycerophosphodiester phosphodiesterase, partial [Acidimicrobiia bacterium]
MSTTHRPLVIAHRGASADEPENTASAFRVAAEQGADWVELDVRLAADGSLIVNHD